MIIFNVTQLFLDNNYDDKIYEEKINVFYKKIIKEIYHQSLIKQCFFLTFPSCRLKLVHSFID